MGARFHVESDNSALPVSFVLFHMAYPHESICLFVMAKIKWLLPVFLAATAVIGPLLAGETAGDFTPQNGFGGVSEGNGALKLFFGKPRPFHVTSRGREQSDGTFRLDQTVTFQGEAPQERFWILTSSSTNHYSGTLSDGAGPVRGITTGSHLSLHYRVKGPLVMHQELELSPDGQTIDNTGVITLLGIPVGRLRETITRQLPDAKSDDPPTPAPVRSSG